MYSGYMQSITTEENNYIFDEAHNRFGINKDSVAVFIGKSWKKEVY